MNEKFRLELQKYYSPKNKDSLSGRPDGTKVRNLVQDNSGLMGLPEIEEKYDQIIVIIPKSILTINPSYFLGLFGKSVRKLSKEGFDRKYKFVFETEIEEVKLSLQEDIDEGMKRAMKDSGLL